jgi:hypothetical protein
MSKYKNGKVMYSRFKVQGLIRSKGHLDFQEKILQGDTLRNLLLHSYSIESSQSLKARNFSSSGKPNDRCEGYNMLNSWH